MVIRSLVIGGALGLGLYVFGFVAFLRGWFGIDWLMDRDTIHHY